MELLTERFFSPKKNCLRIIAATVVFAVVLLASFSCAEKMSDEEARTILAELVPLSQELNETFWGDFLPLANPDATPLESVSGGQYYPVADDAKYRTVADLKTAAEAVFTADYLAGVYSMAFEGTGSNENRIYPRFSEDENGVLAINITHKIFDFKTEVKPETARVTERGSGYIRCTVDTLYDGEPREMRITLRNQNGTWLLDSPTY